MNVKSLTFICNGRVIPGTVYSMYIVSRCDLLSFPKRKTTSNLGDKITLDGDIVLKQGKVWQRVDIISDTGKITHSPEGFTSAKSYSNKLDFKLQKDIASDEWFDLNISFQGIVLIKEKNGIYRVFGDDDNSARFEAAEGSTGDDTSSEKSWIAQIIDKTGKVAPYYHGEILTEIQGSFSSAFSFAFS